MRRRVGHWLDRHPFDIDQWLNWAARLGAVGVLAAFLIFMADRGWHW